MPWQNQGGPWGGGGGGPWGSPGGPRGNNGGGRGPGPQPPNLEDIIRRGQDRLKTVMPGGMGSGLGLGLILAALIALWLASGFYRVQPDEQGIVTRFGAYVRTTQPGLNYRLPFPIEAAMTPKVTRVNRVEIGMRTVDNGRNERVTEKPEESLMLTGDENIVDINFVVFWLIKDGADYLFNIRAPEESVKAAAESTMREIIGQTPIASALAEGRGAIEARVQEQLQNLLDRYQAGIQVDRVQLLKVDPPNQVIDAFRDVQRARADQERLRNEAETYRNDIIPRARGDAERLVQEAEAYKQEIVAEAQGDAQRFDDVYAAYLNAKDVTVKRIYLETLEEVFANSEKIIIDQKGSGNGVVPYLPLPEVQKRLRGASASQDTNDQDTSSQETSR